MDNNYCIMCNSEMTEGYGQVCYNCQHISEENINRKPQEKEIISNEEVWFLKLKIKLWEILITEEICVNNQNLDWLLERAFKGIV